MQGGVEGGRVGGMGWRVVLVGCLVCWGCRVLGKAGGMDTGLGLVLGSAKDEEHLSGLEEMVVGDDSAEMVDGEIDILHSELPW